MRQEVEKRVTRRGGGVSKDRWYKMQKKKWVEEGKMEVTGDDAGEIRWRLNKKEVA